MKRDDDRPGVYVEAMTVAHGGIGVVHMNGSGRPSEARCTLPPRGVFFGRTSELSELDIALADVKTSARRVLVGAPGVGKTQLALEYGHRHAERYPGGTFRVRFDGGAHQLLDDLRMVCPPVADINQPRLLLAGIPGHSLVIYDGVPSEEEVAEWQPPAVPVHVLVTTASPSWSCEQEVQRVPPLSIDDAMSLARHILYPELALHADELVRRSAGNATDLVKAARGAKLYAGRSPYAGLQAFREDDAELFFGRKALTKELLDRVKKYSVVAVYGRSGSGKSSLVCAGLLARLGKGWEGGGWDVVYMRPGKKPLHALAAALVAGGATTEEAQEQIERSAADVRSMGLVALRELLELRDAHRHEKQNRIVLCVDQWEELFAGTSARGEDVDAFVKLLVSASSAEVISRLVVTVRVDFHPAFCEIPFEGHVPGQDLHVGALVRNAILRAIRGPAERAGLCFEPSDLPERIVDDLGFDDALLPLLQFTLDQLWERRVGLTLKGDVYHKMGGVRGALTQHAQSVFDALATDRTRHEAKRLFLRFVIPNDGGLDTCARISKPSEGSAADEVVRAFAGEKARLLVIGVDALRRPTVGVAHEGLIRHWRAWRDWIRENRESLRVRADVLRHRDEWEKCSRDDDALLPAGLLLQRARELVAQPNDVPIEDIRDYVQRSEQRADRLRRSHRRRERLTVVLLLALGFVAAVAFVYVSDQNQDLERVTTSLRRSLARNVAQRVSTEIAVQSEALLRIAGDRRVHATLQHGGGPEERTAGDSDVASLRADAELLRADAFHSVLTVDANGCPVAIWTRHAAPPFPDNQTRTRVRRQCAEDAAQAAPRAVKRNWWYHYFDFREYFTGARALADLIRDENGNGSDGSDGDRRVIVARSFWSEDDGALKYAISVPILIDGEFIGAVVGTAPPELMGHDATDGEQIVVGLLGFAGPERGDGVEPFGSHSGMKLALLAQSIRGSTQSTASALRSLERGDMASLPAAVGSGWPTPPDVPRLPLEQLNSWKQKKALFASAWKPNHAGSSRPCWREEQAANFELTSTDEMGRSFTATLQPVGCAGLVAFAATFDAQ